MTARDLLLSTYVWFNGHAGTLLLCGLLIPLVGAPTIVMARHNQRQDGLMLANLHLGLSLIVFVLSMLGLMLLYSVFDFSPLDVNLLLLAAPLLYLAATFAAVRVTFPLTKLASVRSAIDMLMFAAACAVMAWIFSKFRGWGVVFFGSMLQLLLFLVLAFVLLRRLFRRSFRLDQEEDG
jgi:hypothetical protein